jgi:hypothetical protein
MCDLITRIYAEPPPSHQNYLHYLDLGALGKAGSFLGPGARTQALNGRAQNFRLIRIYLYGNENS